MAKTSPPKRPRPSLLKKSKKILKNIKSTSLRTLKKRESL
jgi:hypothetical protein